MNIPVVLALTSRSVMTMLVLTLPHGPKTHGADLSIGEHYRSPFFYGFSSALNRKNKAIASIPLIAPHCRLRGLEEHPVIHIGSIVLGRLKGVGQYLMRVSYLLKLA